MKSESKPKVISWDRVEQAMSKAACSLEGAEAEHGVQKVFPGAVLLVGRGGQVLYHKAFGCRSLKPGRALMKEDTVFDVSSLTKVLITTLIAMQLVDHGQLDVDRRISHILQSFGTYGKERMSIRHLLTHTSGYPATMPFYKQITKADQAARTGIMTSSSAIDAVYAEIFRAKLEHMPGKVTKYSDVGFILLGHVLEVITATPLDKLSARNIFKPCKLKNSGFIDLVSVRRKIIEPMHDLIAATADCPWRRRILCGEVHDDNAWAMGGIAAHAGLFTTAMDVHLIASELIAAYHGRGSLVSKQVVRHFWKRSDIVPGSTWSLGWDTPTLGSSSSGKYFNPDSVGHLGYTGCSIWIDPSRELDVILLSNRVHLSNDNRLMQGFRPVIHDLVMESLGYAG